MTVGIDQNPTQSTRRSKLAQRHRHARFQPTNGGAPYNKSVGNLQTIQRHQRRLFFNIYQQSSSGNSWYHSGQFTLSRQLSHGLTLLTNYKWSVRTVCAGTDAATYATSSYYVLPWTAPNFRQYDDGLSDFNVANTFVTSYVWQTSKFEKMNPVAQGRSPPRKLGDLRHLFGGVRGANERHCRP